MRSNGESSIRMEIVESHSQRDDDVCNSIPRGGPIYVPNLVSPITRIAEFEASIIEELRMLEAELFIDSSQTFDEDDLSVDELKVYTEEELVNKALKEAFKDDVDTDKFSQLSEEQSNGVRVHDNRISSNEIAYLERSRNGGRETSASCESLNDSLVETGDTGRLGKSNGKKRGKRGRSFDRNAHAAELENNYVAKVEQLAKIKQKQEEDKASTRLHAFNGSCKSCKSDEGTGSLSEKGERMTSLRSMTSASKVKSSKIHEHMVVSHLEVVLCVEIYHNIRTWVKTQEFLVLGRQTLTELRDNIYCLTDQWMQKTGQHDSSGYFLIEDIFCNDLRDPSAINYSEPVFDWLRNSKEEVLEKWECIVSGELQQKKKAVLGDVTISHLPHFKAVDMHKTRFCDLKFRLGAGYLYCHQGDCKHVMVIRDMRLIHPEDVQNQLVYPVLIFQLKTRPRKCSVCKIYRATKVTVDDKWAPENPCYFCDSCYYLLHYAEDGSLLYEFTVYDYHHE
ncbi:PREDICTED: snRNA-activating protein complex subunit [Nelumbo nucifera]|uniref:snRNA-activating protein complex subunit n=2 Tax=Nelumbo nucifera TaxID=4432 RepID=A0A1U7ZAN6_NELNU|nr:PREDICTED: snRNA-activating protein complex subunit [Nelumbo nucifera]